MCVYVYLFFFCQIILLFFCGSATFRNENYALQVSVSPNLRKDIYTRKGLNTLPPTQRLTSDIFALQLIRESQLEEF